MFYGPLSLKPIVLCRRVLFTIHCPLWNVNSSRVGLIIMDMYVHGISTMGL